ncbi:MAG: histidine phosphatase family protein [Steroidobacteraceae bacterium]|jgi:phosphohistidine phosphatase|nr:histidine phosphatase family protein [Steroidobacteraceae bacterium]
MPLSGTAGGLRLTLVRHGRAEQQAPGQLDFDRALDRRGVAEVAGMAQRCLESGRLPDRLRASAALRTRQTAETFARVLSIPAGDVSFERGLYLAEAGELLALLRATPPDTRHLMLVGHNPGIGDLAHQFAPAARLAGFETAATCTIRLEARMWRDLRPGEALEVQYDSPARSGEPWA